MNSPLNESEQAPGVRGAGEEHSGNYNVEKTVELPGGGSITVTVTSSEPIDERDYMILREDAAREMSACLTDLANSMRPR